VNISNVVYQQTKTKRFGHHLLIIIVLSFLSLSQHTPEGVILAYHCLIYEALLLTRLTSEPLHHLREDTSEILRVLAELGVVFGAPTLIKPGYVSEMPFTLPAATNVLNVVSKCCTLDKRVPPFLGCVLLAMPSDPQCLQ